MPAFSRLLEPRRRPPVPVIFERDALDSACVALFEAEREWAALPIGGGMVRRWPMAAVKRRH